MIDILSLKIKPINKSSSNSKNKKILKMLLFKIQNYFEQHITKILYHSEHHIIKKTKYLFKFLITSCTNLIFHHLSSFPMKLISQVLFWYSKLTLIIPRAKYFQEIKNTLKYFETS